MELYDYLKRRVEDADGFIKHLHLSFTELSKGNVAAEIEVGDELLNPMGTVHGGCLFSICDTVGGTAAMTYGSIVTTTMATISYIRPAGGKTLYAKAFELKAWASLLRYDICVYDEKKELVCKAMMEYFKVGPIQLEDKLTE